MLPNNPLKYQLSHYISLDNILLYWYQFSWSLSCVWLFETPWTAARQASLSITNSWSLLKLMSNASVMPSSHLILCCPLLLLPPTLPSIRVFSNESTLRMRWPKYWSFSFSINSGMLQADTGIYTKHFASWAQVWAELVDHLLPSASPDSSKPACHSWKYSLKKNIFFL